MGGARMDANEGARMDANRWGTNAREWRARMDTDAGGTDGGVGGVGTVSGQLNTNESRLG